MEVSLESPSAQVKIGLYRNFKLLYSKSDIMVAFRYMSRIPMLQTFHEEGFEI